MNNIPEAFDHLDGTAEATADQPVGSKSKTTVLQRILQGFGKITMILALASAVFVLALHLPHVRAAVQSAIPLPAWCMKSAIPLTLVGVSYACILFALQRTLLQRFLGLLVCFAFIGWGSEQFISDPAMVALIDDSIVFLFVLDLSLMIREHLKGLSQ